MLSVSSASINMRTLNTARFAGGVITGDGGLDIGVFGSAGMLDAVIADRLVEQWRKALLEFVCSEEPERT